MTWYHNIHFHTKTKEHGITFTIIEILDISKGYYKATYEMFNVGKWNMKYVDKQCLNIVQQIPLDIDFEHFVDCKVSSVEP